MTNISLYHAAQDIQQKIALSVDPETGEIDTDKLDMIEATFKDRAVAVVAVYKGKGHTIDTLKSYLTEIQAQIKREQANQERLKDYLQACMSITGTAKISSDDGLLSAILLTDRYESVEIDEVGTFPAELSNKAKQPDPSET